MEKLFNPKSVAIIGASHDPKKLGYQILDTLIKNKFNGNIYPVNPSGGSILNLQCFPKVLDIDSEIDLAVIIVPAKIVPSVLAQCVDKNIGYAIIVSAGFSEMGREGEKLQKEIIDVIKDSPLRVVGPNCLGVFNAHANFDATFAAPTLIKGNVSAVFQSGALGVALLDWADKYHFGFSKFVSLGNKIDIDESELIEYLADDPDTKIIALYLENISRPQKFLAACRKATEKKPVIILKGGTTNLGAKAAFSHTAALVQTSHTTKAIFSQANLIVAPSIEGMLNIIQILSSEPQIISQKLFIITNAGGPGILATDMAAKLGMELPLIDDKNTQILKNTLSKVASIHNPLDLAGEAKAKDYDTAIRYAISQDQYAAILVLLTPQTATEVKETAEILAGLSKYPKPIIASFLGDKAVAGAIEILNEYKIPHFDDPEIAVFTINKIARYWQNVWRKKFPIDFESNGANIASLSDPLQLVHNYDIAIPESGVATNMEVAMQIVARAGYPVAVKNVGKFGEHKFKAGKVKLNITGDCALENAIKQVQFPVLIQQMVDYPFEVIIGAKRDNEMGIILTFGWGGVFVEDLDDIAVRILPLTECDLDEMIRETKIGRILVREKVDLSGVKNILIAVCQIMTDYAQITEIDLNPVKVSHEAAVCVDARYNTK
jgi:acetyl coenzyme A synthetase (ADP forming)-like protein